MLILVTLQRNVLCGIVVVGYLCLSVGSIKQWTDEAMVFRQAPLDLKFKFGGTQSISFVLTHLITFLFLIKSETTFLKSFLFLF